MLLDSKVGKGCEFSHSSFCRPAGAFHVPNYALDDFFRLYRKAFLAGEDLHLTEKHRSAANMIVMDIDLKFSCPPADRLVTPAHVDELARSLADIIKTYVDLDPDQTFRIFVTQKPAPVAYKDGSKDGLHLVVPDVVVRASVHHLIRADWLPCVQRVFEGIKPSNHVNDIVDEAVIDRNNWMMYGSRKPSQEPYLCTRVYGCTRNDTIARAYDSAEYLEESGMVEADYITLFSLRNKYVESKLLPGCRERVDAYDAALAEQHSRRSAMRHMLNAAAGGSGVSVENTCDNIELVRKLVDILDPTRSESYNEWIRIGWCLRNVDHRLLDKWVQFSGHSSKYVEGECEKLWSGMRLGGLGLGSLHMWARQDNPDAYSEIIRNDLFEIITRSITGTHHDVARVVYHMYKYDYSCVSLRNKQWYEFRNHRWHKSDMGCSLRRHISSDVFKEYINVSTCYQSRALAAASGGTDDMPSGLETDAAELAKRAGKFVEIALKLKCTNFKDNLMKECAELFYHDKFMEKLDSACHLIGFENGVYDLEMREFRDGQPDDYVSFSTGINYIPFNPNDAIVGKIKTFLAQVLPIQSVRDYVLNTLASFVSGHIAEERFHIWTGSGSNGKSMTVELLEKALGEYACKFPVTLLTQKRCASNAANSELARAKGKRCACLQEPSEDERLNIGLMKELTGGDRIIARHLYCEPIEFRPQFKMMLLCNHLPQVPSDDGGTWRRIRVVEFRSRFVDNPDPTADNEFPINTELGREFEEWKEHFASMLIHTYCRNAGRRIAEPDEVTKCTREYQRTNDHYSAFCDAWIEQTKNFQDDKIGMNDLFAMFRMWIENDHIPLKPKKKDLEKYIVKNLAQGKTTCINGEIVFRGFRLRSGGGAVAAAAV